MSDKTPYKSFGEVLKKLRAKAFKTPAEVSSAVEIEESRLRAYENGEQRPTEDVLLLLIQHFNLTDTQAAELWKLAGYHGSPDTDMYSMQEEYINMPNITLGFVPQESKIVYTDLVQVMVNNYGVVMQFLQSSGNGTQPLAVAKVGMSKEHARSVVALLQKTLEQADNPPVPKRLGTPKIQKQHKNKQ
jgi:transcriptional regulator with XRE-family HTH domain